MESNSNAIIARNTIMLYIRMLVSLVISLYTSRVILQILGENDFGIYNVIGGVIVLFSFLTNAMTSSTQRFLNYSLGQNDPKKISIVFNTSIFAHLSILGIVLILGETVGLWFISTQLNIPLERYSAAMWVYQASIIATLINIMVIPYRASIIATERMGIFAYISILDVVLKLIIVLILPYFKMDSLILYSILIAVISLINLILYIYYCRKKIPFTSFNFIWDKSQYKEQISFSGWYLFGGVAMVGSKQGTNIIINIFYNVAVNAAVGIANQVRNAVFGFVSSFQTAFNPQIVKLYAVGDQDRLLNLIYRSSKFSYYLLFILSLPIVVFCEEILSLWLVNVPDYTIIFTQLVIITAFIEALSAPLWTAIGATGKIQKYQFWVSLIILFDIPLVYIIFKLGFSPVFAFVINLAISILAYLYRLFYIKRYVNYTISSYCKQVVLPCIYVSLLSIPIPILLRIVSSSSLFVLISVGLTVVITCLIIYSVGLNKTERAFILTHIVSKMKKKKA